MSAIAVPAPEISVVVVAYNSGKHLERCLESIRAHLGMPGEVIVVDNASTDGSVDRIAPRWPQVRWIRNQENVGFGRACNQALRLSAAPAWLLLNPDAELTDGAAPAMADQMSRDQELAVLGPGVIDTSGRVEPSAGWIPSPSRDLFELLLVSRLGAPGRLMRRSANLVTEVDWVSGCCMLVRASAAASVGLFDEHFFLYVEDMDWCYRFKLGGWKVQHFAGSRILHRRGSSVLESPGSLVDGGDGVNYFVRKHGLPYPSILLKTLQVASLGSRGGWRWLKGGLGDPRARKEAAMYGRTLRRVLGFRAHTPGKDGSGA